MRVDSPNWWQRRPLPHPARLLAMPAAIGAAMITSAGLNACEVLAPLVLDPEEPEEGGPDLTTVGGLRRALRGIPSGLEVVVRAFNDQADFIGGISSACAQVEHGDEGGLYFAIDCYPDDAESEPAAETPEGAQRDLGEAVIKQMAHRLSPTQVLAESLEVVSRQRNELVRQLDQVCALFGLQADDPELMEKLAGIASK